MSKNVPPQPQNPPKIFLSYAHKDASYKDELKVHLEPMLRGGLLTEWDDNQIKPGSKWHEEIVKARDEADMAVMLVSPDFLASDYIHKNEFDALLAKDKILWIAVSASGYKYTPLKDIQCANHPDRPLDALSRAERNKAWQDICDKIILLSGEETMSSASQQPSSTPNTTPPAGSAVPDRFALSVALQRLTDDQRNIVLSDIANASHYVPAGAATAVKINELLKWAESVDGCGLDGIVTYVQRRYPKFSVNP